MRKAGSRKDSWEAAATVRHKPELSQNAGKGEKEAVRRAAVGQKLHSVFEAHSA